MFEDIQLDNTWVNVYAAISKPVETPILLQNKTGGLIYVWTEATVPATPTSGFILTSLQSIEVDAATPGCFVKGLGALFVQEIVQGVI